MTSGRCASLPPDRSRPAAAGPAHALGAQDNGRTCSLAVGQSAHLQLPEAPTSGFRWQWVGGEPGSAVLRLVDSDYQLPGGPPGAAGGQGLRTWQFQALAPGEQRLHLQLARAGGASVAGQFECVVQVGPAP